MELAGGKANLRTIHFKTPVSGSITHDVLITDGSDLTAHEIFTSGADFEVKNGSATMNTLVLNGNSKLNVGDPSYATGSTNAVVTIDSLHQEGTNNTIRVGNDGSIGHKNIATLVVNELNPTVISSFTMAKVEGDVGIDRNSLMVLGATRDKAMNALKAAGIVGNDNKYVTDGGATLYLGRLVNIASGKGISIGENSSQPNALKVDSGATLVIDKGLLQGISALNTNHLGLFNFDSHNASVTLANDTNIVIDGKVDSNINGAKLASADRGNGNVSYTIVGGNTNIPAKQVNTSSLMYNVYLLNDGTFSATPNALPVTSSTNPFLTYIYSNMNESLARFVSNSLYTLNSNRGAGADFIRQNGLLDSGRSIDAVSKLGVYGGAISALSDATAINFNQAQNRLEVLEHQDKFAPKGLDIWVTPFYQAEHNSDLKSGKVSYGTDQHLGGVALGGDYSFDNARIGALFTIGSGSAEGKGNAKNIDNDIEAYGLGVYGGYSLGKLTLDADAIYTKTTNKLKYKSGVESYERITASADAHSFSVGAKASYKFEPVQNFEVSPFVGVRYTSYNLGDYKVRANGSTVSKNATDSYNQVTIPVGVKLALNHKVGELNNVFYSKLGANFNLGNNKVHTTTAFVGVDGVTKNETEVGDKYSAAATLGYIGQYKDLSFNAEAEFVGGKHTKAVAVNANVSYQF